MEMIEEGRRAMLTKYAQIETSFSFSKQSPALARTLTKILGTTIVLLAATLSGWAQGDRGIIRGYTKDPSGAALEGAAVSASEKSTNAEYKTVTGVTGDFTVPSLPVGTYRIQVEKPGFKTVVQDNVVVAAGDTVSLDLSLDLGTTRETVEVTAEASILQSETARVASQISNKLVADLPLVVNGAVRSPFDLAAVTPDVSGSGNSMRVGGGRASLFGMTLDGNAVGSASANGAQSFTVFQTPSIEALSEFAVETGGFKAESGHASGGTVSFVSRSGTNQFHGRVYEFLHNDATDARNFFSATRTIYKQNDFGVAAGGPVVLPKIYNGRDRTFFFFSYEGFRNRLGAPPTPSSVPPPAFFQGDLRNWVDAGGKMYAVYDPGTTTLTNGSYVRTPFPGNQIPVSRFDSQAKAILAYVQPLLAPNVAGLVPGSSAYVRNNFISSGVTEAPQNKYSIKADQALTSKQRLSAFFGHTLEHDTFGAAGPSGLPEPLAGNPGYNLAKVGRLSHDYTLTPTLLNRVYAGVTDYWKSVGAIGTVTGAPFSQGLTTQSQGWKSKGICIQNYPYCDYDFPLINFGSNEFTTWGVAGPNGAKNLIFEARDDLTKIRGPHTFKIGYYYNESHYNGWGEQNFAGNMTFSPLNTSVPLNTNQATGGGSAFASFLLGQVSGYSLDTPRYLAAIFRAHALYAQDDWHVTKRLTLNLGLRWELNQAPVQGEDRLSDFNPTLANPAAGGRPGALVFAGSGSGRIGRSNIVDGWNGFGPRFGFAYSVNSKTTFRGSAGLSYGPVLNAGGSAHSVGIVGKIVAADASQGLSPLWTLQNGPPPVGPLPDIDPSAGNGNTVSYYNGAVLPSKEMSYSFNIQRQLTGNLSLEVGYVALMASRVQSSLLTFNALNYPALPTNLNPFSASGRTLLNSLIGSSAANAAGIASAFSGFNALWGGSATVAQSLRPFPQFATIDTAGGGGDRVGHSTYNALEWKLIKRYSSGLTLQGSYVFSKFLTDSDSAGPEDPQNRKLEKSIAASDQTHVAKIIYSYDLPFGPGRKYLTSKGILPKIAGGWQIGAIHSYVSGLPIALGTTVSFPLFAGTNRPTVSTYNGWRGTYSGNFDPNVNSFFQSASFFGAQPTNALGNATRFNPRLRDFAGLNENVSLVRSFPIRESLHLEIRAEAFNLLNRVQFGALTNANILQNANFGLWRNQQNTPRQMQFSLRVVW
jgi:hypothetical protein